MIAERLVSSLADRYRIERELGAGGMATVYLAADLKHDRKVAIKVFKPELAAVLGAERFVQEIKTTAALSHPHILPLFDSGTADGFLFYVMPYIEGETIRERLNRETQLGIEEAVKITSEVADALDYAHRHGVIHRDIKPENILLHDGRPMVMDFGIALAVSAAAGGRMTETGLSLGTPHYMSPEQATADKQITARSDVYSLASVLYEMLAGEPPHTGGSAQAIIMKIIAERAQAVTELRTSVPPNVAAALAKALEKVPADRFASAREFADALHNPLFTTGVAGVHAATAGGVRVLGRHVPRRMLVEVLGAALIASIVWAVARESAPAVSAPVSRAELNILTPTDSGVAVSGLDVSRDGSMIVYSARLPGSTTYQLYLRRLEDRTARPIPGTDGARYPAFSPDGASIAFLHELRAIRRIPVGGVVVENVWQSAGQSSIWPLRLSDDGSFYFNDLAGLHRVSTRGGPSKVILSGNPRAEAMPLPGGRHVVYTVCCSDDSDVRAVDVETGETRSLGLQARFVRYMEPGYLLLITDDAVKAVAFDARQLTVHGVPHTVFDSVTANGSVSDLAVSANGTAVYLVRPRDRTAQGLRLALADLAGNERVMPLPAATYYYFRFSPDGRRVAYVSTPDDNFQSLSVFVYDLVVGTTTRLTRSPGSYALPVWLAGGAHVMFTGFDTRDSIPYVARAHIDGSGRLDTLWQNRRWRENRQAIAPLSVTPDGKRLLLMRSYSLGGTNTSDLVVAPLDSVIGTPSDYLVANWNEQFGVLSPDGRWVAYESNEEAPSTRVTQTRVYVRSFPEPGQRYAVSDNVGRSPVWAPDGKTIYYWRGPTIVAASVATSPTFRVASRRDLPIRASLGFGFDISPDGRQFMVVVSEATGAATPRRYEPTRLVVVANWIEELRRKLTEQR